MKVHLLSMGCIDKINVSLQGEPIATDFLSTPKTGTANLLLKT